MNIDGENKERTLSPSIKWNTIVNFIGFGYVSGVGIIFFPLFLHYLGPEAFGLVSFFTLLNAWMQLLDMGVSPLLSRQAALARGKQSGFLELKKILRSIELVVFTLAITVFIGITTGSTWISESWLKIESLELSKVSLCITLMGVIIALRFFSSLYRSGIQGLENQVRLNIANMSLVTLKFGGALLLLHYVTLNFVYFFVYQLLIAVVEVGTLATMFYKLMPPTKQVGVKFFWKPLKPTLPFAGGIAYSAAIWVLLTQSDKMIVSNILTLSEFGYFMLATTIATGILQISGPISQAILPRMTHLLSRNREREMLSLYSKATQLTSVLVFPISGMVAVFSYELMFAWTGNTQLSYWAEPILFWLALGNGIMAINAFQYYLLYAHGKLRMHVVYNTVTAAIQIPLIFYAAFTHGAPGVAITWFAIRLMSIIIWSPIVLRIYAPDMKWSWFFKDIAPSLACTSTLLYFYSNLDIDFSVLGRIEIIFTLIGLGLAIVLTSVFVSTATRKS